MNRKQESHPGDAKRVFHRDFDLSVFHHEVHEEKDAGKHHAVPNEKSFVERNQAPQDARKACEQNRQMK